MESNKLPKKVYLLVVAAYISKKNLQSDITKKKLIDAIYENFNVSIKYTELTYLISQIKLLDSRFNINRKISDKNLTFAWKLLNENTQEFSYWIKSLKNLLNESKNNTLVESNNIHNYYFFSHYDEIYNILINSKSLEIDDKPSKSQNLKVSLNEAYSRSIRESAIAILNSNQKCEAKCKNELFLKLNSNSIYLEAHHLIPISKQRDFEYSIDVSSNIVALCPSCHREIHLGKNRNILIEKIYKERLPRLNKCLINISLERLIDYY